MIFHYNSATDLLYLRLDPKEQEVVNKEINDDITLDMGEGNKIVGIEILDASKKIALDDLLPLEYRIKKAS